MTGTLRIYRCSACGWGPARAFAFWWCDAGPVTGAPSVWCPACQKPGTVVDQDGQPADPLAPPTDAHNRADRLGGDVNRAVNRALRAQMAEAGRRQHGGTPVEMADGG